MELWPLDGEGRGRLRRVNGRPEPHGGRRVGVVDGGRAAGAAALRGRREAVPARARRRLRGCVIRGHVLPSPAGVDAEDADDEDAELEEDEGRGRHDHHRPAGAEDVALSVVPCYEHCNGRTLCCDSAQDKCLTHAHTNVHKMFLV